MAGKGTGPFESVLITGISGLVGSAVFRVIEPLAGKVTGLFRRHPFAADGGGRFLAVDLRDATALRRVLDEVSPTLVVNCAACPDIAPCETDPRSTHRINVASPVLMAAFCAERGARFVHISSDQVFDGRKGGYSEADPLSPVHEYGRGKAEAERRVLAANGRAVVARISLVIGKSYLGTRSSSESLLANIRKGASLRLFTNEFRTPVLVDDVARAVLSLATDDFSGLVNVAGPDRVNRLELGKALAARFGLSAAGLHAALSDGLGARPPRPLDLSLDTSLAAGLLPFRLRGLDEALAVLS
jgi:dTDP-4-dehydrorhamnose reductase